MTILSGLTEQIYSDRDIMGLFSGPGTIRRMLAVEAALARAQAHCGVIPNGAARSIHDVCHAEDIDAILDLEAIATASMLAGNIAIPFVKQLTAAVRRVDPEAARFVHWGATSQDVLDTALVLQLQQVAAQLDQDLDAAQRACARLTAAHRDTIMVGRTWLQHALPTTFGVKTAGWKPWRARSDACGTTPNKPLCCNSAAPPARWPAWATPHPPSPAPWPKSWAWRCPICPGMRIATGWPIWPRRWAY